MLLLAYKVLIPQLEVGGLFGEICSYAVPVFKVLFSFPSIHYWLLLGMGYCDRWVYSYVTQIISSLSSSGEKLKITYLKSK